MELQKSEIKREINIFWANSHDLHKPKNSDEAFSIFSQRLVELLSLAVPLCLKFTHSLTYHILPTVSEKLMFLLYFLAVLQNCITSKTSYYDP